MDACVSFVLSINACELAYYDQYRCSSALVVYYNGIICYDYVICTGSNCCCVAVMNSTTNAAMGSVNVVCCFLNPCTGKAVYLRLLGCLPGCCMDKGAPPYL
jgi:hypothetical protein